MTGKLHPKDFNTVDPAASDTSSMLVNNLIRNNVSGRNIKFNTT